MSPMTTVQQIRLQQQVKVADMQKQMIYDAMRVAEEAMQKHQIERQVAKYIKEYFDQVYYPYWHCLVGKSFSTVVTYESRHYLHFTIKETSIVLFKFG